MNNQICEAIQGKCIIEFYYKGGTRIVEPHCYGIHKTTNNEVLRAYRVGGYSESESIPPWRLYRVDEISSLTITDEKFDTARDGYNPDDSAMSDIFCHI